MSEFGVAGRTKARINRLKLSTILGGSAAVAAALLVPGLAVAADPSAGFTLETPLSTSPVGLRGYVPVAFSGAAPQDLSMAPAQRLSAASTGAVSVAYGDVNSTADYTPAITVTSTGAATITAGNVTTSGIGSTGILANAGGAASIIAASVATSGYGATAIQANAGGDINITAGSITTTGGSSGFSIGPKATGVYANSTGGDVTINVGDVTVSGGAGASGVNATGHNVTITTGNVSGGVFGVYAHGVGAGAAVDLTVNGDVSASASVGHGIVAISDGTVDVTVTGQISSSSLFTRGFGAGIYAHGGGDVTVDSQQRIKTYGREIGVNAVSDNGNVTINASAISVYGEGSIGISAVASNGTATVNAGDVVVEANEAAAISAIGGSSVVTLSGQIQAPGQSTSGIYALGYTGGATVHNNGSITIGYGGGVGIRAVAMGDVLIDGQGSVTTGPLNSYGVIATSRAGSVSVTQGSIISNNYGVLAVAQSTYSSDPTHGISINVGTIKTIGSGASASGIVAIDYNGGSTVNINAGSISTAGDYADGVRALAFGTGSGVGGGTVTITGGSISTRGSHAIGVDLEGTDYNNVTLSSVTTSGAYNAPGVLIRTNNLHYGWINANVGSISTSGAQSPGLYAYATGPAKISVGSVTTSGSQSLGVGVLATGDVNISAGSIATAGYKALGLVGESFAGGVTITETGAISTLGDQARGLFAAGYGPVSLTLSGTVTTKGLVSPGVVAVSDYGDVNVTANAISTAGDKSPALTAYAQTGTAKINIASAVTTGDGSQGLLVVGGAGVNVTAGQVSTSGDDANGVDVTSGTYGIGGVGVVNVNSISTSGMQSAGLSAVAGGDSNHASTLTLSANSIATTGQDSPGIIAMNAYGALNIQASSITTQGSESTGILAIGHGDIGLQVGAISTRVADGIYAYGTGSGAISLGVTGKIASSGANGVVALNMAGSTNVTITSGGGVSGAADGIQIQSTTGQVAIANAGTIAGGVGYAIDVIGMQINEAGQPPPTTPPVLGAVIDNTGTISGGVYLAAANNTLSNEGTFNATKDSVFGAGSSFTNTGTVNVSGQVTFQGLSSFQNSGGLVDLRGGPAGTTFTLAGNYAASGNARLGLGADDELVIKGQASGATSILLGASPATATMFAARPLVQMGAGSTATFTLANADVGLVHYSLSESGGGTTSNGPLVKAAAAAPITYSLSASAGQPVYATLKLEESGQTAWRQSADAWSAHLAAMRGDAWGADSASGSGRIWAQVYRSTSDRDGHADASYGQLSTAYEQTDVGVQIGGDLMRRTTGLGQVVWGLTGGYDNSSINGKDNISQSNIDTLNIGGYASLFSPHGVFANALVKYDHNQISTSNAAAGYSVDLTGNSVGFQVELGQRFGDDRFDFEPLVSLNYVHTRLDNIEILNQSLAFNDDDGLSAKFGGRVSTRRWVGGAAAVFYAGASVVDDFSGDEKASFTSGGMSQGVSAKGTGVYGQGVIGVSAHTSFGLSLYVEGNGDFGGDYNGSGFRIGGRFNF